MGDAKDFCALLKWAKDTFWEVTGEGVKAVEVYPAAIRLAVAETMQALALCFESVERAHRSLHGLGGSKGSIKVCHYDTVSGVI